jgi:hypothetical protein
MYRKWQMICSRKRSRLDRWNRFETVQATIVTSGATIRNEGKNGSIRGTKQRAKLSMLHGRFELAGLVPEYMVREQSGEDLPQRTKLHSKNWPINGRTIKDSVLGKDRRRGM